MNTLIICCFPWHKLTVCFQRCLNTINFLMSACSICTYCVHFFLCSLNTYTMWFFDCWCRNCEMLTLWTLPPSNRECLRTFQSQKVNWISCLITESSKSTCCAQLHDAAYYWFLCTIVSPWNSTESKLKVKLLVPLDLFKTIMSNSLTCLYLFDLTCIYVFVYLLDISLNKDMTMKITGGYLEIIYQQ